MKILLIEDDKKKTLDIQDYLVLHYGYNDLVIKKSYQSGLRELLKNEYDLLLLDMSIPTWDKNLNEAGGSFEKFGGLRILQEITRKKKIVDTILITMFDDFGKSDTSVTLSQLDEILRNEFSNLYRGAVYYNTREDNWKTELDKLIHPYISKDKK